MSEDATFLTIDHLIEAGFGGAGQWKSIGKDQIRLEGEVSSLPGVYAFSVAGVVQYVGVASRDLRKRLGFYARPGSGQRTNIRLNLEIRAVLNFGGKVAIHTATPPDFEWGGLTVRGAHGLEAGLISSFHLPWNIRSGMPLSARSIEQEGPVIPPTPQVIASGTRSKYGPLRAYLEASGEQSVSLSFAQIEQLVGPLPKSAYLHQAWWGNNKASVQARCWMDAGYHVEANPSRRSVVFRKYSY